MPDMRMEMSKKNKYYIDKERKYELIHFCRQYKKWKEALRDVQGWSMVPSESEKVDHGGYISDPVARAAAVRKFYTDRLEMIEEAAYKADPELSDYIIKGITEDLSYDNLLLVHKIPCCKDVYYDRRAKFLWILDQMRG